MCKPIWRDGAATPSCVSRLCIQVQVLLRIQVQVLLRIQAQVRVQKQKEWRLLGVRCSSSDSMTRGWAEMCSAARGSFSTLGAAWWVGAQGLASAQYARTRHTATTFSQTLARRM